MKNDHFNVITDNEALAVEIELQNGDKVILATIYCPNGNSFFYFYLIFFLISSLLQNLIRFTTTQHYCFPVTHDPTMSMTSNCWHTTKSCKMYKSAARETLHSRVPRTL